MAAEIHTLYGDLATTSQTVVPLHKKENKKWILKRYPVNTPLAMYRF